ncbi:MAG TPA: hypothetical protein VFE32_05880 [Puia sp.]|jgi:hypothetical protein|nr:hypothetical protein [Puia sp.]
MRISTKIFLLALLVLAVCLGSYDEKLAAEFRKGEYTNPYYGYVQMKYKDFDEVELRSATSANVMLVRGDFKVLMHPQASDFVVVRQEGKRLIIEAKFQDHLRSVNARHMFFISCPKLKVFQSDAEYQIGSVGVKDFVNWNLWWWPTTIRGFSQDTMTIREEHASNVVMEGDTIKRFTAVLGAEADKENGPVLTLGQGNHFDSTNLDILSNGRLWVKGTDIRQLTYHLADSASISVNGVSARYLNLH